MSVLNYNQLEIINELKNHKIYKSPLLYAWDNKLIIRDRPKIFSIKDNIKLLLAFSSLFKNYDYIAYKTNLLNNKKNIVNIDNYNILIKCIDKKIGLLVIDLDTYTETKNILNELNDNIDENTIIFMPYLVNFEDFELKSIRGLLEFVEENNLEINWIGINGDIKLYEFKNNGYNNGVCFSLRRI